MKKEIVFFIFNFKTECNGSFEVSNVNLGDVKSFHLLFFFLKGAKKLIPDDQ